MAIKPKGDITLKLDDQAYTLRPTFAALCGIEDRLGAGILPIAERFSARQIGVADCAAIITLAATAGGHEVEEAKIGEAVIAAGLFKVVPPLIEFLNRALAGPPEGNAPAPSSKKPG